MLKLTNLLFNKKNKRKNNRTDLIVFYPNAKLSNQFVTAKLVSDGCIIKKNNMKISSYVLID